MLQVSLGYYIEDAYSTTFFLQWIYNANAQGIYIVLVGLCLTFSLTTVQNRLSLLPDS